MEDLSFYLPVIWAGLIATAVMMYVVLDGFDLGIGILYPFASAEADRDRMINSIAPFWDGNETWLILGGGGLWVAFPAAYAAIMPANYLPVIVMLLALVFRGVSFEFRAVSKPKHRAWDAAFFGGSLVAAFAQGVILGNLISGIETTDGVYTGGPLDWLKPFPLVCGLGLVFGYALLGATWLIARTDGELEERSRRQARVLFLIILIFIAIISLWAPLGFERIYERWFDTPQIFFLWLLPAGTVLTAYWAWRGIDHGHSFGPFIASIVLFILCYLGLAISTFPYLVPPSLTVWDTAAVPDSQVFTLIGVVFMLPIILGYTVFVYWTFLRHGKVTTSEGYH
ncbi:cytochrome d ubiquinol oxidase subunit II [Bauldia sp.]|uniref:cytochrome d ubiquinol oxidase subunit II n=1 Tax=Bauldia sp. TaxID=2575872 RepID=UPI003BA99CF9